MPLERLNTLLQLTPRTFRALVSIPTHKVGCRRHLRPRKLNLRNLSKSMQKICFVEGGYWKIQCSRYLETSHLNYFDRVGWLIEHHLKLQWSQWLLRIRLSLYVLKSAIVNVPEPTNLFPGGLAPRSLPGRLRRDMVLERTPIKPRWCTTPANAFRWCMKNLRHTLITKSWRTHNPCLTEGDNNNTSRSTMPILKYHPGMETSNQSKANHRSMQIPYPSLR